jgi:hypothetical protein
LRVARTGAPAFQPFTIRSYTMKDRDNEGGADQAGTQTGESSAAASPAATTQAGTQEGAQESAQQGAVAFPYAAAGAAFTNWFNEKVSKLSNPTVMLGTKRARVTGLYEDGRLAVEVETEALEPEKQFVAFDASHLDQLVRKIAALGL